MTQDLATIENRYPPEKNFHAASPAQMLASAVEVADVIAPVIRERGLCVELNKGAAPYVLVEGWVLAGAMLGLRPREKHVVKIDDYWLADVEIVSIASGQVVGQGSAICSKAERMSGRLEDNQIRSKAITRAQGKAYNSTLRFVMKLAGYETTPKEEIEDFFTPGHEPPKAEKKTPEAKRPAPLPPRYDESPEAKRAIVKIFKDFDLNDADLYPEYAANCIGKTWNEIAVLVKQQAEGV